MVLNTDFSVRGFFESIKIFAFKSCRRKFFPGENFSSIPPVIKKLSVLPPSFKENPLSFKSLDPDLERRERKENFFCGSKIDRLRPRQFNPEFFIGKNF